MEPQRQKCIRCKMKMTMDKFKQKRDGSYQKTCDVCLEMRNVSAKKHHCEHGRQKNKCIVCGGVGICEHGRVQNQCKDCGGIQICAHDKQRSTCKLCSDPLKITIKHMLCGSKASDKKYDMYDVVNFVDYDFVENLLDDYSHCCYPDCDVELQIIHYQDDLATIERLDNNIGHIKSNCVICCLKCNVMNKPDRH